MRYLQWCGRTQQETPTPQNWSWISVTVDFQKIVLPCWVYSCSAIMWCGMDHPSIFISLFSLPFSPPATGIQFIALSALSSPFFSTIHSSGMRPLHFFWLLWAEHSLRFRLYLFWRFQCFVFCVVAYKCYFYVYLFLLQNDVCIFPLSNCQPLLYWIS